MPITRGQSNPSWTVEETLLALELLQANDMQVPPRSDPRRIALVALLQSFPFHPVERRSETFRNNEGLGMKMYNLLGVEQAGERGKKGLSTAKNDRLVWQQWARQPDVVQKLAAQIRVDARASELMAPGPSDVVSEEKESFREGGLLTRKHRRRERSPKLRRRVLEVRRGGGASLKCDGCGTKAWIDGCAEAEAAMFEVHHLRPLADLGERNTRLLDVALLCANCHKVIHYLGRTRDEWPGLGELTEAVFMSRRA